MEHRNITSLDSVSSLSTYTVPRITFWILLALVLQWYCCIGAASVTVRFVEGSLTIHTDRYEVIWQKGCMVSLRTLLSKGGQLTVSPSTMSTVQLPNGLGSVFGQTKDNLHTYFPVNSFPLSQTFPAYHCPDKRSKIVCERIPNGARLIYTKLTGDLGAALIQELSVDATTGELVIQQHGSSPHPGVAGIAFSLLNLRPDISLAVPYFGGQRWGPDQGKDRITNIGWPYMWSAGIIIGEVPEGGCFSVWAEDQDMRPKFFRRYNSTDVQALNFEACEDAPYDKVEMRAFAWRFNTYAGTWMEAAQSYKEWRLRTFKLVPRNQRPSKWVEDVALIVPQGPSEPFIKSLSKVIDPKHILFMEWGWLQGFNRRVPEYIPANKDFADLTALAHKYGARVGVYTSLALLDQEAFPDMMREYGLEYFYRAPLDDKPQGVREGWLQYVHPGSARWREFYSNRMAEIVAKYGIDYLYQDVTGCASGSSGLVEGLTFSKAVVACEEAIRAKVPQAAIGGEFWTDVNACQEDFGIGTFQAWFDDNHKEFITRPRQPHPLLSYLLSEYCLYWPHQVMVRDTVKFHRDQNINEVIGAIPVWTTSADDRASEARVVLERARLFIEGFRPYFPKQWDPRAVAYMRSPQGRIAKYVRVDGNSYCFEETPKGDRLRYARVTGASRIVMPSPIVIDGWIAYDAQGPIGLDPNAWYCAFPGTPPAMPVTLTRLPAGSCVRGVRVTDAYVLIEVEGTGIGTIEWKPQNPSCRLLTAAGSSQKNKLEARLPEALLFAAAEPPPLDLPARLPLDKWDCQIISKGQVVGKGLLREYRSFSFADVTHDGFHVHPPLGGKGSEISFDGLVKLPDKAGVALAMSLGRHGGPGDGVHFVVRVNGREVWRHFSESRRGWTDVVVPLGDYAGRAIVLSLALDCGPSGFNTSCDEAVWGNPRIIVP